MSKVEQTIDVDVPLRNVYDQWTQFEEFPRFMEGVEDVRQIDDRHCHWQTKIAGVRREFDTEIVDQLPDQRIAWRTMGGDVRQMGVVSFQPLDEAHTRVRLAMDVEPEGMAEKAADAMGVLDRRVKGDLKRFKGFIEEHGDATGGWRGRIRPEDAGTAPATGTGSMGTERPMGDRSMGSDPSMGSDRSMGTDPSMGDRSMGTDPSMESPQKGPDAMKEPPGPVETPGRTRPARETESWSLPPDDEPGAR
ncbi:polyketide cyclase/dehydrase/lipid transport protein [Streptomyces sp. PanSC19]|nr:polyketide cyclase/dehydrase/lipid transport protein [Streptomyces sp. PanSC19]